VPKHIVLKERDHRAPGARIRLNPIGFPSSIGVDRDAELSGGLALEEPELTPALLEVLAQGSRMD